LKNKLKLSIYLILAACLLLIFSHFWNIAFTGGDDPFVALDPIRKGGFWKASVVQAIGQGRFWLVIPWFLTQVAYLDQNFVWANTLKISSDLVFVFVFFRFIKSVWNESFALVCTFIGLGLFSWYGADFNPLHNVPLWYVSGATFLLLSFTSFNERLKKNTGSFYISFTFYLLGLLFYEIFLFYAAVFPLLYISHYYGTLKTKSFKFWLLDFLKVHRFLFLYLALYLSVYYLFRVYFPSGYEGSKEFHFVTIGRTLRTIGSFSLFMGIYTYFREALPVAPEVWVESIFISSLVCLGLLLSLFHYKKTFIRKKIEPLKILMSLGFVTFFVFSPNLLYGFVDKYHTWADAKPYYLGSFFAALAIIIFISILILSFYDLILLHARRLSLMFSVLLLPPLFYFAIGNFSQFITQFDIFNKDFYKWPLLHEVIAQAGSSIDGENIICTNNFMGYKDSYDIYDYWSFYLSDRTKKNIKVKHVKQVEPDCNWVMNFLISEKAVKLQLTNLTVGKMFESSIDY
jgi:hypothetical protein